MRCAGVSASHTGAWRMLLLVGELSSVLIVIQPGMPGNSLMSETDCHGMRAFGSPALRTLMVTVNCLSGHGDMKLHYFYCNLHHHQYINDSGLMLVYGL